MLNRNNLIVSVVSVICVLLTLSCMFFFRFAVTSGTSMEPTYDQGTILLCVRKTRAPQTGDVVLLEKDGSWLAKRVVAAAGETATALTVMNAETTAFVTYDYWGSSQVPEGYVFVCGDNIVASWDSRSEDFGLVSTDDIWGYVIWSKNR